VTLLVPMSGADLPRFRELAIRGFAEDSVACGRWPAEGALERSTTDFEESLPGGLATPDHHLYTIRATEDGPTVGYLWFAETEKNGLRSAFVNDLEILPEYRRQGHAEAAFRAMESLVRDLGLESVDLFVFAQNEAAQALYRKLGYAVAGTSMRKDVGDGTASRRAG
jgi:ribosomal protein S18 acetylase RimI-like enzyme